MKAAKRSKPLYIRVSEEFLQVCEILGKNGGESISDVIHVSVAKGARTFPGFPEDKLYLLDLIADITSKEKKKQEEEKAKPAPVTKEKSEEKLIGISELAIGDVFKFQDDKEEYKLTRRPSLNHIEARDSKGGLTLCPTDQKIILVKKSEPAITGLYGCNCHPFKGWNEHDTAMKMHYAKGSIVKHRCNGKIGTVVSIERNNYMLVKFGHNLSDIEQVHKLNVWPSVKEKNADAIEIGELKIGDTFKFPDGDLEHKVVEITPVSVATRSKDYRTAMYPKWKKVILIKRSRLPVKIGTVTSRKPKKEEVIVFKKRKGLAALLEGKDNFLPALEKKEPKKSKFTWNKNGVCENPDIIFTVPQKKSRMPHVELRIGERNGKWGWGYQYNFHTEGSSAGCSNPRFKTKEACIAAAITDAEKIVQQRMRDKQKYAAAKMCMAKILEFKLKHNIK